MRFFVVFDRSSFFILTQDEMAKKIRVPKKFQIFTD